MGDRSALRAPLRSSPRPTTSGRRIDDSVGQEREAPAMSCRPRTRPLRSRAIAKGVAGECGCVRKASASAARRDVCRAAKEGPGSRLSRTTSGRRVQLRSSNRRPARLKGPGGHVASRASLSPEATRRPHADHQREADGGGCSCVAAGIAPPDGSAAWRPRR